MANFGYEVEDYTPDASTLSGLLYKIGKQIVDSDTVRSEFDVFLKDGYVSGRDLEIDVYTKAQGAERDATGAVSASAVNAVVRMFKGNTQRTYSVLVDEPDISMTSISPEKATETVNAYLNTLYNGATSEKNAYIMEGFEDADASEDQIVDATALPEIEDKATAEAYLLAVKTYAMAMKKGATSVNPAGIEKASDRVVLIMPYDVKAKVDVYLRLASEDNAYSKYDVDDIITYDPNKYGDMNGATIVCDVNYAQIRRARPDSFKMKQKEGNDNYEAYLHTYYQYAFCSLYNAVRIGVENPPEPPENKYRSGAVLTFGETVTSVGDSEKTWSFSFNSTNVSTVNPFEGIKASGVIIKAFPDAGGNDATIHTPGGWYDTDAEIIETPDVWTLTEDIPDDDDNAELRAWLDANVTVTYPNE